MFYKKEKTCYNTKNSEWSHESKLVCFPIKIKVINAELIKWPHFKMP